MMNFLRIKTVGEKKIDKAFKVDGLKLKNGWFNPKDKSHAKNVINFLKDDGLCEEDFMRTGKKSVSAIQYMISHLAQPKVIGVNYAIGNYHVTYNDDMISTDPVLILFCLLGNIKNYNWALNGARDLSIAMKWYDSVRNESDRLSKLNGYVNMFENSVLFDEMQRLGSGFNISIEHAKLREIASKSNILVSSKMKAL